MSYSSGEAAEQVVRMTLNGVEVAAKISGKAAERLAVLLYAVLKDQKKTRGKTRLTSMLRSGKELKVFSVSDNELEKFCREAKKYGVLYCVLKDKTDTDGHTDVFVRAEDASKINRIFERFACLERRNRCRSDFNGFAVLRVLAGTGSACTGFEGTKTDQLNFTLFGNFSNHVCGESFQNHFNAFFWHAACFSSCSYEFFFVHDVRSFSKIL